MDDRELKATEESASIDAHESNHSFLQWMNDYETAKALVTRRRYDEARVALEALRESTIDKRQEAIVVSDLAVLEALHGGHAAARSGFESALALDPGCAAARENLLAVKSSLDIDRLPVSLEDGSIGEVRVAILSLLFNWPSTGGGIVHTVELAHFLRKAGYIVRHFFASYPAWGIGAVTEPPPFPSEPIGFDSTTWEARNIQRQFRSAVDDFQADFVIITDSWNFKPLLAEAVRGIPYLLRFQAMECICPLNNVRLLPLDSGRFGQCQRQQLSEPAACLGCLQQRGHFSGSLHQAERQLSGVESPAYHERLMRALRDADAVLVVNPLMEAILAPHCKHVRVVTAGMDPARFSELGAPQASNSHAGSYGGLGDEPRTCQLLFAGLVDEALKGFAVLRDACSLLWTKRRDFKLVVTADPPNERDEFARYVGWQSQNKLPTLLRDADILIVPTIAQEALGRTAVEAMAAGIPVIASRLGGLPFTVQEGVTGLLCEPGDPQDLATAIEFLLENPTVRNRMGQAAQQRFHEEYAWDVIIERHYRSLLRKRMASDDSASIQMLADRQSSTHKVPQATGSLNSFGRIQLSLIVSVLESYDVLRRQLLLFNEILTSECELIVVDDGSEPSLKSVCDSIRKTFSFRLASTNDRRPWTQPKARNLGASMARGDKLLFFDIDHILTKEIIAKALQFAGDKLHWRRWPGILDETGRIVTDEAVVRAYGLRDVNGSIHQNSFVIRKELFDRLGGYDERFCGAYGGDDIDFNRRYEQLCDRGIAAHATIDGDGYFYPDPALDGGRMFHPLSRSVAVRGMS